MGASWQNCKCKLCFAVKITVLSVQVNKMPLLTGQIAKADPTYNCRLYSVQAGRLALNGGQIQLKLSYLYSNGGIWVGGVAKSE